MGELAERRTYARVSGLSIEVEIGEPLRVPEHHPVSFFMIPNLFATCPSTTAAIRIGLNGEPYTQCDYCYRTWPTVAVPLGEQENTPGS